MNAQGTHTQRPRLAAARFRSARLDPQRFERNLSSSQERGNEEQ
jgi:hypothetical protein